MGAGVVQLQWEAVDAFQAMLAAFKAWANAATAAEPEATRYILGCDLGAKYAHLTRQAPPMPISNVVQLTPAGHVGDPRRPYWGE